MKEDVMTTTTTNTLKVPGASLYYEVQGTGPVLLCIPGGPTDAGLFWDLAQRLADRYTVVCYDPRGHSRSSLDGPPEDIAAEVHADDAAALLAAVSDEAAFVYGNSGGGTIGLALLTRHPDLVRRLVSHEAPVVELLPDAERFRAMFGDLDATYRSEGVFAAMGKFAVAVEEGGPKYSEEMQHADPDTMGPPELTERMMGNFDLFIAHEIQPMSRYQPDVDALKAVSRKLVSAAGTTSGEQAACRAAYVLAGLVGIEVSHLPGAHGGWGSDPQDFADQLDQLLRGG
jgi:pimeloyl-ACP methyl ester carboxylesterase